MKPTVSAVILAKNEAANIADCLDSARLLCEDLVVYDTGSEDATAEIARRLGAQVVAGQMPDGNFGVARTLADRSAGGDWVLHLDADERLLPEDCARLTRILEEAPADVHGYLLLRYNFFRTGGWYSNWMPRLHRRLPGIVWQGRSGESTHQSIAALGGLTLAAGVSFNHLGYTMPSTYRLPKLERWLRLMDAELDEDPANLSMLGLSSLVLRILGRLDDADARSLRALNLSGGSPMGHYYRAHVLRALGKGEESLEHFEECDRLSGGDALVRNMIGVQKMSLGDLDGAEEAFAAALAIDDTPIHIVLNQGLVDEARGNVIAALSKYMRVAARNPGFLIDDWRGRWEYDPHREFYYETAFNFAGLRYHIAFCRDAIARSGLRRPSSDTRIDLSQGQGHLRRR